MSGKSSSFTPDGAAQSPIARISDAVMACAGEAREVWALIHKNPETGFQEFRAAEALSGLLERHGFSVRRGGAGFGHACRRGGDPRSRRQAALH